MYYIVETPKIVNLPIVDVGHVKYMKCNSDNMFICAITSTDILIWFTTTSMLIGFHQRADNSISIHGENHLVEWKPDSSKIVILTSKGYLIYYRITFENEFLLSDLSAAQTSWNDSLFTNQNQYQSPLLNCKIMHEFSIHIQSAQKNLCCFNEEIFVPLLNGKLIKVPWSDRAKADHFYLLLQQIYFKTEPEGELFRLKDNIHLTEFEIAPLDEGQVCIAGVLSDSSAIYICSDSSNVFRGLIANAKYEGKNVPHKCTCMNPLFRLLAFGCKNGLVVSYNQPDDYDASLQVCVYYINQNETTQVTMLKWSPDFRVLCVLYESGSFALFSVFGSLLYCSKDATDEDRACESKMAKALEFGQDGYSLWSYMLDAENLSSGNLFKFKIAKSSLINNSYMSNIEHLSLNGDREVYVCLNLTKVSSLSCTKHDEQKRKLPPKYQYPSLKLGGNSIWQTLNLPLTYISSNYPIRMSAIDPDGRYVVVAGSRGFTHYSFLTRKWRMFGNADQERAIRVTGGLLWWKEFICLSCFNWADQRNEIRFYSRNSNLDNSYAKISKMQSTILQMNIFKSLLIVFGSDSKIQVYGLEGGKESALKLVLNKLIELEINNYLFNNNPYLTISICLCPLYVGNYTNDVLRKSIESPSSTKKTILINVAGNLLMFQPDLQHLDAPNKSKSYLSLPPVVLSSCVEIFWFVSNLNSNLRLMNYFMNLSLWFNCGSNGLKVWLPLSGEENEIQQSNRILIPFAVSFYPLGLAINESLLIGAASEPINTNPNHVYYQIQKTTQLFLPFVLEGLIRKNLNIDAKKIAIGYRYLPYFVHGLELLIHKILEEEANDSSLEEANRALPAVVEFVKQFPECLRIISNCTRKSEVAVWTYLFNIVGSPRNLFEKCMSMNDFETACSYLIVLQNTENNKKCEELANLLLKTALKNSEWNFIKEIVRFLSAIDPADLEAELLVETSSPKSENNQSSLISPKSDANKNKSLASRVSNSSLLCKKMTHADSIENQNTDFKLINNKKSIENSLYEYAKDLLKSYRVKKLFEMFSNLNFLSFNHFIQHCHATPLIDNYVQAVTNVHFDFNWPYPILLNESGGEIKNTKEEEQENLNVSKKEAESDFIYPNSIDKARTDEHAKIESPLDFDLIAFELANTGSIESEKELLYIMDTFIYARCYEWIFVLSIVLKKFHFISELLSKMRSSDQMSDVLVNSIRKGLSELEHWSEYECCGYRPIIQKIKSL